MTTPATTSAELRAFPFFANFPEENLWHLAKRMRSATFETGGILFREGEPRKLFGILTSGSVAIEKGPEGRAEQLATLGIGEALGEGLLLD
ncbi:MAG: cyclic nucleotide-binding domain-containing protein, partial [Gemmatimonadaceae bacterium]